MNRYILSFSCLLLLHLTGFAQGQKDPAALTILEEMSKRYRAYSSFEAEFTNTLINPDKSTEDISGKITVKDDMYKLDLGEQDHVLAILPPGAFFSLAIAIAAKNAVDRRRLEKRRDTMPQRADTPQA